MCFCNSSQINDLPLAIHSARRTDNGQGIGHIGYGDNGWSIHSPLHQSKVQLVVQHLLLQLTAGCHQYIDLCLRVAFFEQSDIARQQLTANGQTGTDPQLSKAIPIPHLPLYPTKQSQDPPGIAQKDLPGTGDGKAPSDPVEQTHFVIVFQFLDCKAHRRLRHIELSCRLVVLQSFSHTAQKILICLIVITRTLFSLQFSICLYTYIKYSPF